MKYLPAKTVGEDEEVSIKEVADAIVKAVGYEGDYRVSVLLECAHLRFGS